MGAIVPLPKTAGKESQQLTPSLKTGLFCSQLIGFIVTETSGELALQKDTAFEMATSSIRYGAGITSEVGMDIIDMGLRRVMVVTDPILAALPPVATLLESLNQQVADPHPEQHQQHTYGTFGIPSPRTV